MKLAKKLQTLFCFLLLGIFLLTGCAPVDDVSTTIVETQITEQTVTEEESVIEEDIAVEESTISEDGTYTSKDEVAAYLNEYGHLPSNFITKKEAKSLGWVSSEGNLDEVARA